jgi:predicted nucleic acid-binding protein
MIAIDTNVIVYAVDASEPAKQAKAIALLDALSRTAEPLVVPWQVAVEFVACLRRWEAAGRVTRDTIRAYKSQFLDVQPVVMPSPQSLQMALDLSDRYRLSYWDSLLIAACIEAGVGTLYTEDLNAGAKYDAVSIINPFS